MYSNSTRINRPSTILLAKLFTVFLFFACLQSGCKKKQIPDHLKMHSAISRPGAIVANGENLLVGDLSFPKSIYEMSFNFQKYSLSVKQKLFYNCLDIRKMIIPEIVFHPCAQAFHMPAGKGKNNVFWNPEGACLILGEADNSEERVPQALYTLVKSCAGIETDNKALIIAQDQLYMSNTAEGPWTSTEQPMGPPSVYYSGLVYLPESDSFLTMISGNGEALQYKLDEKGKASVVARYPAVTDYPLDMDYDPENKVFWITDPADHLIHRITAQRLMTVEFKGPEAPESSIPVGGQIDSSVVWDKPNYTVDSDITITAGASLTVKPGVHIYMDDGKAIYVNGKLIAEGAPGSRIEIGAARPGDYWSGIVVREGSTVNLKYCEIRRARLGVEAFGASGLSISETIFRDMPGHAVRLERTGGRFGVSGCWFRNIGGAGLLVDNAELATGEKIILSGNLFEKTGYGAVLKNISSLTSETPSVLINDNIVQFTRRTSFSLEGVDNRAEVELKDNVFLQGSDLEDCVHLEDLSQAGIVGNFVRSCGGAGVLSEGTTVKVKNNVFDGAVAGVVLRSPAGKNEILSNVFRHIDYYFWIDDQAVSEDFHAIFNGNYLETARSNPGEKPRVEARPFSGRIKISNEAATSPTPGFVVFTTVSALDETPAPWKRITITGANLASPVEVVTNAASRARVPLEPGKYAAKAEGGMSPSVFVVERGEISEMALVVP